MSERWRFFLEKKNHFQESLRHSKSRDLLLFDFLQGAREYRYVLPSTLAIVNDPSSFSDITLQWLIQHSKTQRWVSPLPLNFPQQSTLHFTAALLASIDFVILPLSTLWASSFLLYIIYSMDFVYDTIFVRFGRADWNTVGFNDLRTKMIFCDHLVVVYPISKTNYCAETWNLVYERRIFSSSTLWLTTYSISVAKFTIIVFLLLAFLRLSAFSHFICLADATHIQIWNPRDLRWVNRFRCLFRQNTPQFISDESSFSWADSFASKHSLSRTLPSFDLVNSIQSLWWSFPFILYLSYLLSDQKCVCFCTNVVPLSLFPYICTSPPYFNFPLSRGSFCFHLLVFFSKFWSRLIPLFQ